jgi:hypothetical protein
MDIISLGNYAKIVAFSAIGQKQSKVVSESVFALNQQS